MRPTGIAIKVRTLRSRPESERWSADAINDVVATPDAPNPKDPTQRAPKGARETKGTEKEVDPDGGHKLDKAPVRHQEGFTRNFRITDKLIEKFGYTAGCRGCEAKIEGTSREPHSATCRQRLEEEMMSDDMEKQAIERRDQRRAQRRRTDEAVDKDDDPDGEAEIVDNGDHGADDDKKQEPDKQADAAREPQNVEVDTESNMEVDQEGDEESSDDNSEGGEEEAPKRRRLEEVRLLDHLKETEPIDTGAEATALSTRRAIVEKSVKQVMERMIRGKVPGINALCTREAYKTIIEALDEQLTVEVHRRTKEGLKEGATIEAKVDVAEAYSPPRMAAMAAKLGYTDGFSLDLTGCNSKGVPWDLSRPEMQEEALEIQEEQKPWMLVTSPPCTWFCTLMGFNVVHMDEEKVRRGLEEAVAHVAFAVIMCLRQAQAGRRFLFEHPCGAKSWTLNIVNKLLQVKHAAKIAFDFCMLGMKSEDEMGEDPAKKRTSIITNSQLLAHRLSQYQCDGNHRHVKLINGRARKCQEYPDEFCELVCRTVMEEKNIHAGFMNLLSHKDKQCDVKDVTEALDALTAAEYPSPHDDIYEEYDFVDDTTGKVLDHEQAAKARRLEMDFFRKKKVYEKVPRKMAEELGAKVVTTRWLDINKGDEAKPNYRSRLVGREIKTDKRLDLFAATPPLESLKVVTSICASNQQRSNPYRILSIDIKRAYFCAPATRPVFIEIPVEDYEEGDEGRIGKLNVSLYGTRDAAQNWTKEYTEFLSSQGFRAGVASPCNFVNEKRELFLTVHGDDFTITGPAASLTWMDKVMSGRYEIKSEVLGPENGQTQELRILNRVLRWTGGGIEYEPDQRHAEIVVKEMNMQNAKPVGTPAVTDPKNIIEMRENSKCLEGREATAYRGLTARINFLAQDRADLQFAVKGASKHMANPREYDWIYIKRIARYLVGKPRYIQMFKWQSDKIDMLTAFSDSDWAGDKESRKSTSGGVIKMGEHLIKTWSTTQQIVAMSSGEAELYALVKAAAESKGIISSMNDFGKQVGCTVFTDANAALGISHRVGLGKTRHIDVRYLWIQGEVRDRKVNILKIDTHTNPADMMTKDVDSMKLFKHLKFMNCEANTGRADTAPQLNEVSDKWRNTKEVWHRNHNKSRRTLFTPMRVAGGPGNAMLVGETRVTIGQLENGERFKIVDDWKDEANAHRDLGSNWTGITMFVRRT